MIEESLGYDTWYEGGCSRGDEYVAYWVVAHLPGRAVFLTRGDKRFLSISVKQRQGATLFWTKLSDAFIPAVRLLGLLERRRREIAKKGLEPLTPAERSVARTLGELEPARLALEREVNRIFREFYDHEGGKRRVDRTTRRKYRAQGRARSREALPA